MQYLNRSILYLFQHPGQCITVFMTALLIGLSPLPVTAQPLRESGHFRSLRPGHEITVLAATSRRTDVVVDGQPEITTTSSETVQIQYRVVGQDRSGNLVVRLFVQRLDCQPPNTILARLRIAPILLSIQPDGRVHTLNSSSRESLIMNLSNGDPEGLQFLRKCLTDETIAAWFSIPFWMLRPADSDDVQSPWERNHEVSLGTLGSLQLDLSFRPGAPENGIADITISGAARFRPLVLPAADAVAFPFLSDPGIEVDEISGIGRVYVASQDETEGLQQRPEFKSVEWTIRLHGDANLLPAKPVTTEQDTPDTTSKVTFRQTQNHVWTLQHFTRGKQGMLFFDSNPDVPQ